MCYVCETINLKNSSTVWWPQYHLVLWLEENNLVIKKLFTPVWNFERCINFPQIMTFSLIAQSGTCMTVIVILPSYSQEIIIAGIIVNNKNIYFLITHLLPSFIIREWLAVENWYSNIYNFPCVGRQAHAQSLAECFDLSWGRATLWQ